MNAKSTTSAPKAPAFDLASFTLEPDFSVEMPANIPKASRSTELPFKAAFTKVLGEALSGRQPHFFLPDAFWLARGSAADKVDASYGRSKVRDAFNKWVKEDEKVRSALDISFVHREKGLVDAEGKPSGIPGVSYWVIKKV